MGPLLFNIYLNDLFIFLEKTKICNYVDDITIYACRPKIETTLMHLKRDALKITEWLSNKFMKPNEEKYHQ